MEAIAIIGMAGRFPQAANLAQFWRNLCSGVEGITFFSEAELLESGLPHELIRRPDYVRAKGFLDDAEYFDAAFFGYHPRDADVIDPQQRLLLETAWSALEDAGYIPDQCPGLVGVFVGVSMNTYLVNNLLSNRELLATVGGYQVMISNDKDYAATRLSYQMNLKGPSMGVQTACSTSLVAVERACRSLANHECDMALAGGASLAFPRRVGYLYQDGMILSPDGHCRVFDAQARGTVGGEGVGVVVLKRLSQAQAEGDQILAVIRGWATNNDGSDKIGFTAPAVAGQAQAIAAAQAMAGIDPRSIGYVEAHGTGTELGDPIEISALTQVFRARSSDSGYCRIGSIKSNIGHLDAAAGVAGLIKAVLALKHRTIPPSLHFENPNPHIDFANSPFRVNAELFSWDTNHQPRRAAVSSFGIGGTNAHVVLEEAAEVPVPRARRADQLLLLSAKSEAALDRATENLAAYLQDHPELDLADVAYTLQIGRKAFPHRRALVCQNSSDAIHHLRGSDASRLLTSFERFAEPQVAFLFPGQGAQHPGMGRGIYESEHCFRKYFDLCADHLRPILDGDLRELLFRSSTQTADESDLLRNTALAQPAIFAVEYALAKQWEEWGIRPAAMIGHSIGEYVAACLANVFSLPDALWLVAHRGQLMQSCRAGAMLAVPLSPAEVQELLRDGMTLAAFNAPANCVVAGPVASIVQLEDFLRTQGFESRRLQTSHAFHSPMMAPIRSDFRHCVEKIERRAPSIPFISNLTGTWITDQQAIDPDYWVDHLLNTVRFADGMTTLMRQPRQILLEVGPGQALTSLTRQISREAGQHVILPSMRHPQDGRSDMDVLLQTVARIWLAGGRIDWSGVHRHESPRRVSLPTYPFERKRHLVEPPKGSQAAGVTLATPARYGPADWFYVPRWRQATFANQDRSAGDLPRAPSTWLLMSDAYGIADSLGRRLRAAGHVVVQAKPGPAYVADADSFTIQPERFGDYVALFDELRRQSRLPDRIVHLWNVTRHADAKFKGFEEWQQLGFYSLLYLAQVLGRQPNANVIQLDVISSGVHEVTGNEQIIAEKSTLRGPLLVIPQEYPHVVLRSIDLENPSESTPDDELLDRLFAELDRDSPDAEVAIRGRHSWTRMHDRLRLAAPRTAPARLRERGVYWLIGGLGQIGLAFARELARTVQARIVLTGRSSLPPREQWEQWCDQRDPDEPEVKRCRQIMELESLGAQVRVLSADIADATSMAAALDAIDHEFGELHGVIHCAGRVEGRIIHYLTPVDCEAQFRAKVLGLYTLEKLIADRPLDFCLITSSLSSVLGGMGFCAYAAANAFMDAFAQRKNREGSTPWLSVNWDGWRFDSLSSGQQPPAGWELLLSALEGGDAFARLLAADWPDRVVVSTSDLPVRTQQWATRRAASVEPEQQPDEKHNVHPRPANLSAEFVAPRSELEKDIAEVWQQMLGIERIGIYDNYIELGGHSLLAGQLISRLRATLKVPLSIRSLFESPTIALFAAHVETQRWAMQASQTVTRTASLEHQEEIEL